jgi:hypothetical protein
MFLQDLKDTTRMFERRVILMLAQLAGLAAAIFAMSATMFRVSGKGCA